MIFKKNFVGGAGWGVVVVSEKKTTKQEKITESVGKKH